MRYIRLALAATCVLLLMAVIAKGRRKEEPVGFEIEILLP